MVNAIGPGMIPSAQWFGWSLEPEEAVEKTNTLAHRAFFLWPQPPACTPLPFKYSSREATCKNLRCRADGISLHRH
jgi:hypothetical protein